MGVALQYKLIMDKQTPQDKVVVLGHLNPILSPSFSNSNALSLNGEGRIKFSVNIKGHYS